jgi:WD40 repeat protein
MNQRLLNGIAIGVVGLVAIGAIVVAVLERTKPLAVVDESHMQKRRPNPISAAEQKLLAQAAEPELEPNAAANIAKAAPEPVKTYTWAEVEQELKSLRAQRATSPHAWSHLEGWYNRLCHFSFSQSKDYPQHIKKLEQWRAEFPDSPTPVAVLGRTYICYAWDARGSGFAFTVSDVGWELYHQRIEEAKRLLEEAVKLGPADGEAHARLIEVAKAQSWSRDETEAVIDAGRALDPTYFPLYQEMAVNLLPRWGGAPGDVEKFAASLVEKIPGDDGLIAFALVARRAHQYENLLFDGQYDRNLLGNSAVALAERFPKWPAGVHFAALASVAAQDHAAAKRIRPLVGEYDEKVRIWPWKNMHTSFLRWADAEHVPTGEEAWIFSPEYGCRGMAFAPNERYLWTANQFGRAPVELVEWKSRRVREVLPGPGGVLSYFAFDPGSKWAAASFWNGPLQGWMMWDTANPGVTVTRATDQRVNGLAIHPTAPQIAWTEMQTLRILDVPTDEVRCEIELPAAGAALKFSPDGRQLVVNAGIETLICDPAEGKVMRALNLRSLLGPQATMLSLLSIDHEGRIYVLYKSGAQASLVRVAADGKSHDTLIKDLGDAYDGFLSPDGELLAVTLTTPSLANQRQWQPSTIDVWVVASSSKRKQLAGHWNRISNIAFAADNTRLASVAEFSDVIKIWSLEDAASPQAP